MPAPLALAQEPPGERAETAPVDPSGQAAAGGGDAAPLAFGADQVRLDVRSRSLFVRGNVHVDQPPFHFTSNALELQRVPLGIELVGGGRVTFCPCLGGPLAVRFTGATLAPPHDAILRNPVLELFGVSIAWAPVFWLRSPGRVGLLPPELAWRATDGLFAGGGLHLPLVEGDTQQGIDLRGGGYVQGGVAIGGTLRLADAVTVIGWDRLHGRDGVTADAFGAAPAAGAGPSVAWDAHAVRGARALEATTDVDVAARRFDRAQAEAYLNPDGWTVAAGVRTVALRGGGALDFGAGGPVVAVRSAGAIAHAGAYDVTFEGGQVTGEGALALSFVRAEAGGLATTVWGPVGASLAVRSVGEAARGATSSEWAGAVQARATARLPLVRAASSSDEGDPWVHLTEPRVEIAAITTRSSSAIPLGRGGQGPSGQVWVGSVDWSNAIGRWGTTDSAEIDVAAGAVGDWQRARPSVRARADVASRWLGLRADVARVLDPRIDRGGALLARARIGETTGLHLVADVAGRDGVDPVVARGLLDPTTESANGFLVSPGWTGSGRLGVPLGSRMTARGGADLDLSARTLVAVAGALELHDPCNCVVVRASGAHRIGRPGEDVWVTVDLPMSPR